MAYRIGKKNAIGKATILYRKSVAEAEACVVNGKNVFYCENCQSNTLVSFSNADMINHGGKKQLACSTCHHKYMVYSNEQLIVNIENGKTNLSNSQKEEIRNNNYSCNFAISKFGISKATYYKIIKEK